ncbi:MAG: hypothetical protein Q8N51_00590 [Gammaproteobacteria bacterium]|nr:hypothetical protein [Gammaproteobacteria bacterium]
MTRPFVIAILVFLIAAYFYSHRAKADALTSPPQWILDRSVSKMLTNIRRNYVGNYVYYCWRTDSGTYWYGQKFDVTKAFAYYDGRFEGEPWLSSDDQHCFIYPRPCGLCHQ